MSHSTGPSTLKDLSSILKTYFSPIRQTSTTTSDRLVPEDVITQAEVLVNQLGQQDSAGGATDQALREKAVKGLVGSLLELGAQLGMHDSDGERHRLSSTLLVVLEQLYTDERARALVVDKLQLGLMELWWTNLLQPSVMCFPSALEPGARASLVNLVAGELARSETADGLAAELFGAYSALAHEPGHADSAAVLRTILVRWAKARPRAWFEFIDGRISAGGPPALAGLAVLVDFVTSWPYSTHHLLATPLVASLVSALCRDYAPKSGNAADAAGSPPPAAVQLVLRALLLILPRIPVCLESLLPRLFLGYARALLSLCSQPLGLADPALLDWFSFLYGLFPSNFLCFLSNPPRYLQDNLDCSSPALSPIDSDLVKRYTIPILTQHRLCRSLIESDPESERKEIFNQLKLFESAELIEKCERNLIVPHQPPDHKPLGEALSDAICQALGSRKPHASRHRRSASVPLRSPITSLEPVLADESYEALRTSTLVLNAKLNVELYLKQQHLQQMGSLHKQNILSTGLESEVQNLHTINRELRRKLELVDQTDSTKLEQESKQKTNTTSYNQLVKDRMARYREEKIELTEQNKELANRLNQLRNLYECQTRELTKVQTEAHGLRNEIKLMQPRLENLDDLQAKNDEITKALLTWDDDLRRFRESRKQIDVLRGEWKRFESLANRTQIDNEQLQAQLQRQTEINHHLQTIVTSNSLSKKGRDLRVNEADQHIIKELEDQLEKYKELNVKLELELNDLKITGIVKQQHFGESSQLDS